MMNRKCKEFMIEHGFKEIDKKELENYISKKNKHISIDVTNENGDILLCRSTLEKARMIIKDDRLIIYNSDKYNTYFLNVIFDSIINCMIKKYDAGIIEILFSIENQNIDYKIQIHMGERDFIRKNSEYKL